jgi:hypothetical protein
LAISVGGGILIGRTAVPTPAPTVTKAVGASPSAKPFGAVDDTWCHEYQATSTRLADAGEAAAAPRHLTAPDLPASAWTPDDTAANRRFADYLATWTPGLARLRGTADNPAFETIVETNIASTNMLVTVIRNSTYMPADFSYFRTQAAADRAILAACKELVG